MTPETTRARSAQEERSMKFDADERAYIADRIKALAAGLDDELAKAGERAGWCDGISLEGEIQRRDGAALRITVGIEIVEDDEA